MSKLEKINGWNGKSSYVAVRDAQSYLNETHGKAAYSMGIGSCLIARAEDTFDTDTGQKIQNETGVPPDFVARVHIALGYPKDGFKEAKERKRKDERILIVD